MAQVPYTGVTDVAPESKPVSPWKIDTPGAAFGTNVAEAISHLGKTQEGIGSELNARAVALQQLDQEAAADNAHSDYIISSSEKLAKFKSQRGKNAVDGLGPLIQEIEEDRKGIAAGLGSPAAQKSFNSASRRSFAQTIFAAQMHAAEENRTYLLNSSKAATAANRQQVITNPNTPGVYDDAIRKSDREVQQRAALGGLPPEEVELETMKERSVVTNNLVMAQAESDPFLAEKTLEAAEKKGMILPEVASSTREVLKNKQDTKSTVKIAAEIWNEPGAKDLTAQEFSDRLSAAAKKARPDDPVFTQRVVNAGETFRNKQRAIEHADATDRQNLLEGTVNTPLDKAGKLPTTLDELPPDARAAYDNSDKKTQAKVFKRLSVNAAGGYQPTPENQRQFTELWGALNDPDKPPAEREKVLSMDLLSLEMPAQQIMKLQNAKIRMQKDITKDPMLSRATRVLGPILNDDQLGLKKTTNNPDRDWFLGALQETLVDIRDQKKGPPTDDEIKKAGAMLIQKVVKPKYDFWSADRVFQQQIPEEYKKKIEEIYKSSGAPMPTDLQMQNIYTSMRIRQMSSDFNSLTSKGWPAPDTPKLKNEPAIKPVVPSAIVTPPPKRELPTPPVN